MKNRVLIGLVAVLALAAAVSYATKPSAQSGRNRDARQARETPAARDDTPTMTDDDVAAPAAQTAPVGHAPAPSAVAHADAIAWQTSFAAATSTAKSDQLIFVDVYTDWCGWCKYMDQQVYSDKAVQAFAARQVFVKLNAEDNGEGTAFARRAGVRGYPTLLVFSHDGHLVAARPGAFRAPRDFLSWIQAASAHM